MLTKLKNSKIQSVQKRTAAGRGTSSFFSSEIIDCSLTEAGPTSVRAGAVEADDVGVMGRGGGGGD